METLEGRSLIDPDAPEEAPPCYDDLLFDAIRKNHIDSATMLIRINHAKVNQTNSANLTPLYIAMDNRNLNMTRMLLENDADINAKSYCHLYCTYETPIVTAARLQDRDLVDLLLGLGSKLEGPRFPVSSKTALQWAATFGNIAMAKQLLEHGADINWIGMYQHTALHYATIGDKPDMVKWLLDNGSEVGINGDGRSPLHIAAVRGNLRIVKCLVAKDCRMDVRDSFSFTPISLACLRGHLNIAKHLYSKSKYTLELDDCLHKAAEGGHTPIVRYLLNNGAKVNKSNACGETALAIAAKSQYQITSILLENGAKINVVDNRGYTSLQHALIRDQRDIAALLIRHGALLNTTAATESPLHMAFMMSNPLLVKYILQAGCHMTQETWFNPQIVKSRIQEADFQVPASMRFCPNGNRHKQTWEWIYDTFDRTRTLGHICRIAIREQLVVASGGASILARIEKLPLPKAFKSFLTSDVSEED